MISRRVFIGSLLVLSLDALASPLTRNRRHLFWNLKRSAFTGLADSQLKEMMTAYEHQFGPLRARPAFFENLLHESLSAEGFLEKLQIEVREDFATNRIWHYDGWILSQKEVELTLRLYCCPA